MRSEAARPPHYRLSLAVLGLVYLVGSLGIASPLRSTVLGLSAFNLVLTATLLSLNAESLGRRGFVALLLVGVFGFSIEVLGVKTGAIFGDYAYTSRLGPKSFGVPWVIGLNWALLIHAVHAWVGRWGLPVMATATWGATVMAAFDWVMEPAAIALEYWRWATPVVPLRNYGAWWLLSFLMLVFVEKMGPRPRNRLAPWVLSAMIVFFLVAPRIRT
jgi:putative membrane protein